MTTITDYLDRYGQRMSDFTALGAPVAGDLVVALRGGANGLLDAAQITGTLVPTRVSLYVATTGNDSNTGLASNQAFLTLGMAIAYVNARQSESFKINVAAGTYTENALTITTTCPVWIAGPTKTGRAVPTAIIDATGGGNYVHGIVCSDRTNVELSNIKVINATGDGLGNSRCAVVVQNQSYLYCLNVHVDGATWAGIYSDFLSILRVSNGIINACRDGIAVNQSQCTVGYNATSLATSTLVTNATEVGILWSRGSQGHIDYAEVSDCVTGVLLYSASRAHFVSSKFTRGTNGLVIQSGGMAYGSNTCDFNYGGADMPTTPMYRAGYAMDEEEAEGTNSASLLRTYTAAVTETLTGTTSATVIAGSFATVPAYRLDASRQALVVEIAGEMTSVSAGTLVSLRMGGSVQHQLPVSAAPAAGAAFQARFRISWSSASGTRWEGALQVDGIAPTLRYGTKSIDLTVAETLSVVGQLGNAADTMTIRRRAVWYEG